MLTCSCLISRNERFHYVMSESILITSIQNLLLSAKMWLMLFLTHLCFVWSTKRIDETPLKPFWNSPRAPGPLRTPIFISCKFSFGPKAGCVITRLVRWSWDTRTKVDMAYKHFCFRLTTSPKLGEAQHIFSGIPWPWLEVMLQLN